MRLAFVSVTLVLLGIVVSACGDADPVECFYATSCHKTDCNGPIVRSGCNAQCGAGEVDDLQCHGAKDGGSDATDAAHE